MTWLKKAAIGILVLVGAVGVFGLAIQAGGLIPKPGPEAVKEASDEEVAALRQAGLNTSPTADTADDETAEESDRSDGAEEDTPDRQTVSNVLLGLTFQIPSDYIVWDDKPYGPSSMTIASFFPIQPRELEPGDDMHHMPAGHMKIEILSFEKTTETSLSAWLEDQQTELERDRGSRTTVAVDGREAIMETGGESPFISYYINIGHDVVIVTAHINESEMEQQQQVFDEIIGSFSFNEAEQ